MSRVAQFAAYGEPASVIELVDEDYGAPGPGEVLIGMEAACLHIADLKRMRGEEGFAAPLPGVPCAEGVGRIVEVGDGVQSLGVGDLVLPPLGSSTCREILRLPAQGLIRVDGEADPLQLAMATVNPPTAYLLLNAFVTLEPGEWVVMNAANSATCRYLFQLAAMKGIRTIAAVRRPDVANELRALGCDAVLTDGDDLHQQVADVTDGAVIRLGLDAIAGDGAARIARCLGESATILTYGILSGEDVRIPLESTLRGGVHFRGFMMTRTFRERYSVEETANIRLEMAELVAAGKLKAKIAATYPLERIADALSRAGETGANRDGKVIVTMGATV